MKPIEYKNYKIRTSGKNYFKVVTTCANQSAHYQRFRSIEAAKVAIDSYGRVMTKEEHAIMYPNH